ncbi:hypothetical protein K470DRAFT_268917 [Piedraia hortae CBS 480.64]|uniref:NADH-ubiquinone reductase complex 1 MLRQ subunit n=1 Tax=Piedraia hortae CBS 480.64 TaxID=1314780 RepID=A0A6A7C574_9PEZI|nr:hypothetical protein K470DRAFT_268917 [Piedraia hortae CBS 480.64]
MSSATRLQRFTALRFPTAPVRGFRTSALRMGPVPQEEQSAHTVSQRLRKIKNMPAELWPLAIIMTIAVTAAGFSLTRKLFSDKTLRLNRQGGEH